MPTCPGKRPGTLLDTHHLQLDLYTQGLLLDGCHAGGEGFPHAGRPAQGQLGATLQACNRAREHRGTASPAQKQVADDLSAGGGKTRKGVRTQGNRSCTLLPPPTHPHTQYGCGQGPGSSLLGQYVLHRTAKLEKEKTQDRQRPSRQGQWGQSTPLPHP